MKQREIVHRGKTVALWLGVGVFFVWGIALTQHVFNRLSASPLADPTGVGLAPPSPTALTLAPPASGPGGTASGPLTSPRQVAATARTYLTERFREARQGVVRRAAGQAARAYQQALSTAIALPPARSVLALTSPQGRFLLPRVTSPWPSALKPMLVVEPASPAPDGGALAATPGRQLRLTLPDHLFANQETAAEAAQLIALQLVEQGYHPTCVISGPAEAAEPAGPAGGKVLPAAVPGPPPPRTVAAAADQPAGNLPPSHPDRQGSGIRPASDRIMAPLPAVPSSGERPPVELNLAPSVALDLPTGRLNPPPSDPTRDLLATLRGAVGAEFRAYRSLPTLQTEELATYFSGAAYQSVVAQLQTFQAAGHLLSNPDNPSFSRFQGISGPVSIVGDTATVKGREGRALHWYDPANRAYVPHTGQRQYVAYQYRLERQNGRWKIVQRTRL